MQAPTTPGKVKLMLADVQATLDQAARVSEPHSELVLDDEMWQPILDGMRYDISELDELSFAYGLLSASRLLSLLVEQRLGLDMEDVVSGAVSVDDPGDRLLLAFNEMTATTLLFLAAGLGHPAELAEAQALLDELRNNDEPLLDPDCRDDKHRACVGGLCECDCHQEGE